ncbi:hypothetical protein ES703_54024 [subsurface metagenome]
MGGCNHKIGGKKQAFPLIAGGRVNRDLLISGLLPLKEVSRAFELQAGPAQSIKVMVINE